MHILPLFFVALTLFGVGAGGSLLCQKRNYLAHIFSSAAALSGSALALMVGSWALLRHSFIDASTATSLPLVRLSVHIDPLASLFLVIVSAITFLATLYGIAYMRQYFGEYNLGLFGFFYNLFIASLLLVVTAHNGLYFLFVWELMSLSSLFLVLFEYRKTTAITAGLLYFLMTHIATAFLLVAFLLLYHATGSFDFAAIHAASASLSLWTHGVVAMCLLIGFGTKAGIIPLHIWLPKAHSAAPSHVSALMSGVMIKMGVLMLFRMFLDVLPAPLVWLGYTVLVIGAVSSVLGVLFAFAEHDSKRLLAYHSIENIGIILLGLGAGLVFLGLHHPALAALAIVAGLFHTINHAVFKSLLFFSAGSVIAQTGTRNIERYGGLIKRMPVTALFFLVGAIAISGLPPFNGFASEWLTYQGLFAGVADKSMLAKIIFMSGAAALALTGGLAAACFVKAFGITFLARPRSEAADVARESSLLMTVSMGMLAGAALLLGVGAHLVVHLLQRVTGGLAAFQVSGTSVPQDTVRGSLVVSPNGATLNMAVVLVGLLAALLLVFGLVWLTSRRQKVVYSKIWACGYQHMPSRRAEITATGFARTLIIVYKRLFRPSRQLDMEPIGPDLRYFAKSSMVTLDIVDIFDAYMYRPLHPFLDRFSQQVKKVQSGNLNQYLLYIFVLLIGLMVWVHFQ